ncbi:MULTISPECIES: hypothetical protein [unclassified Pseudonocardia]|uniref:hypothetical protein n=1 Tax=unclassified Pseudonocardia TaxID=2619320 RepID=UPI0011153C22|nr:MULTISPECIES: hypothetical protein [unclassified Pseudonocardia]
MNRSRVRTDRPREDVLHVRVDGELDAAAGASLLRQVDAHLAVAGAGWSPVRHVLVDLGTGVTARGARALHHLRHVARNRGLDVRLIGAARVAPRTVPDVRAVLHGMRNHPDLDSALAELPSSVVVAA